MTIDKNIRLLKKGEVEEKRRRRRGEREAGGKEEDYKPPDKYKEAYRTFCFVPSHCLAALGVVVYKLRSPE